MTPDIIEKYILNGAAYQLPTDIVIHALGEYIKYKGEIYFATDFIEKIGLSVHAFVRVDGTLHRQRKDLQGAYHAKGFNSNSLGIEFLVPGVHDMQSFTDAIKEDWVNEKQLEAGLWQVKEWRNLWNIKTTLRHSDISPERKVDPGTGFPWEQFLAKL